MVHSITVKTDTKEILSKCKVASAGSDAQSRCAWIVCKRVSKRLKRPDQHCKVQVLAYPLSVRPYGAYKPVIDMLQAEMTVKNLYSW